MPKFLLAAATLLLAATLAPAQATPMPASDSLPTTIPVFLSTDIGNETEPAKKTINISPARPPGPVPSP